MQCLFRYSLRDSKFCFPLFDPITGKKEDRLLGWGDKYTKKTNKDRISVGQLLTIKSNTCKPGTETKFLDTGENLKVVPLGWKFSE